MHSHRNLHQKIVYFFSRNKIYDGRLKKIVHIKSFFIIQVNKNNKIHNPYNLSYDNLSDQLKIRSRNNKKLLSVYSR